MGVENRTWLCCQSSAFVRTSYVQRRGRWQKTEGSQCCHKSFQHVVNLWIVFLL